MPVSQSSNDYLSLTNSPRLRQSYLDRLTTTPSILGSTGSRLLSGSHPAHTHLETRFSRFFEAPASLLFNSGWDGNVSFFSTVPQSSDWVIYDELVHASVHSGLRASRVPLERRLLFSHNRLGSLRKVLKRIEKDGSGPTVFLALESLYSMDGDFAPLKEMLDVLDEHVPRERQCVVLDEAHSTGIYGGRGRGVAHLLSEAGAERGRVGVRLMTFGKAVGCSGGAYLTHRREGY